MHPNESSTVIWLVHRAQSWRGEISTHYDSNQCGCEPDVLIEYTGIDGVRRVVKLSRGQI